MRLKLKGAQKKIRERNWVVSSFFAQLASKIVFNYVSLHCFQKHSATKLTLN